MADHTSWTRRSALGLFAVTPLATSGVLAATGGRAGAGQDRTPRDLLPGGGYDRFIADRAARDAFSGTVLLTRGGRTLLSRSYRQANRDLSLPNRLDTVFSLGSVTKVFTAIAAVHAVQHGMLSYRDTVGQHLTGFPDAIATTTVHHLLTHTSGLGDYMRLPGFEAASAGWDSPAEELAGCVEFIRANETPAFPPGAGWRYSNSGYVLLGALVQAASGQSYYDYVRRHVFTGLRDTDFVSRDEWRADRRMARPYATAPSGERVDDIGNRPFFGTPAGDASSTAPDLDRLFRALVGARLLDPVHTGYLLGPKLPVARPMAPPGEPVPQSHFQCYGPSELVYGGERVVWKNGGSPGVSTIVESYPDSGYVSIVLSNYDEAVGPVAAYARNLIIA